MNYILTYHCRNLAFPSHLPRRHNNGHMWNDVRVRYFLRKVQARHNKSLPEKKIFKKLDIFSVKFNYISYKKNLLVTHFDQLQHRVFFQAFFVFDLP